jgi:hypothetical protein
LVLSLHERRLHGDQGSSFFEALEESGAFTVEKNLPLPASFAATAAAAPTAPTAAGAGVAAAAAATATTETADTAAERATTATMKEVVKGEAVTNTSSGASSSLQSGVDVAFQNYRQSEEGDTVVGAPKGTKGRAEEEFFCLCEIRRRWK